MSATKTKKTKHHKLRTAILVITAAVTLTVGAVLGGVFGSAVTSAKKSLNFTAEQSKQIAKLYAQTKYAGLTGVVQVNECDRDLHLGKKLAESVYYYKIELVAGNYEVDLVIDASTGQIVREKAELD